MIRLKLLFGWLFFSTASIGYTQTPGNNKQVTPQKKSVQKSQPKKGQSNNHDPDFFLVIDSTLGDWKNTRKVIELRKKEYKLNTSVIDANGTIYALGSTRKDGLYLEHIYRFTNEDWQLFEQNISGEVLNLVNDGKGNVYAVTPSKLYRATGNLWEEIAKGTFTKYNVFTGFDGNIYFSEQVYEKKVYAGIKLFKVTNTKPELSSGNGKPLIFKGDLYVDRAGNIYEYDGKETGIKIWNGKEWKITGDIQIPANNFWAFDENNTLFISGHSNGKNMFIKVLNGLSWKNLEIPDSISKEVHDWQLITDTTGKIYLKADIRFEQAVVYRINGDKFELMAIQPERKLTSQKIVKFHTAGNKFIALQEDHRFTDFGWKYVVEPIHYTPVWNVKIRKMANIPNYEIVSEPYMKDYRNLNRCFLSEDNGKFGIQTLEGRIIAEPVFDKIYVSYTPSKVTDLKEGEDLCAIGSFFCFTLIQGKDTLFSKIGKYDFELPKPGTLEMFKCKVSSTCNYCKGKGVIEAHTETITVKGEWIPPAVSTFTSTTYEKKWNGALGRDVMYMTTKTSNVVTSGGGYKPDTQKTIHVPEQKCNRCNGNAVKRSYQVYEFNRNLKVYSMKWN